MDAQAPSLLSTSSSKTLSPLLYARLLQLLIPPEDGNTSGRFTQASLIRSVHRKELVPAGTSLPFCGECTVKRLQQDDLQNLHHEIKARTEGDLSLIHI